VVLARAHRWGDGPPVRWGRAAPRAWVTLLACHLATCARATGPAGVPGADHGAVATQVIDTVPGVDAASESETDQACLRELDGRGVAYARAPVAGGMRTPVEITGPVGAVALVARGRRSAVMDCVLARALARAGGIFQELGVTGLAFSAAFDVRTRRGSSEVSAHAYGLAIDVHVLRGSFGEYDVRQRFERGVGAWRGLRKDPALLDACVGQPVTSEGRMLRQLACRLKLHPAFRVIVTPDDDADHQDHLHLEAGSAFFPPRAGAAAIGLPPKAPPPVPSTPETTQPAPTPPSVAEPSAARSKSEIRRRPNARGRSGRRRSSSRRRRRSGSTRKPRRSYWGDYDSMAVGADGFHRVFSDSTGATCVRQNYTSTPLGVSESIIPIPPS